MKTQVNKRPRTITIKAGEVMAIVYNKLLKLFDENGYTSYKIKKENVIGQGTLTALKNGTGGLDSKTISKLCKFFNCQPGDIMEYAPDTAPANNEEPERV